MIDENAVKHIAQLARLELTDDELKRMQKDLAEILDYVDQLKTLDIENIQPSSQSLPLLNVMRPDKPVKTDQETIETMLNQAPERSGRHYKVKEILQ